MRITLLAVGSRGDVQPLLGFGLGLTAVGHEVRVAAFPGFEQQVRSVGLEFAPLAEGRISRGGRTAADRRVAERGSRQMPAVVALAKDARSVAGQRLADALAACEGADAIVTNELALLLGWQAAEHFGAKLVRVRLCPPPRMAHRPVARGVRQAAWLVMRGMLASARRQSGLPPLPLREPLGQLDARQTLELYAFSPAVVPKLGRSGPWTHVTGYWFLDSDIDPEPPDGLEQFLAAGPAPVCIGFGSMIDADPTGMTELAVQALRGAGQRGVLLRGAFGFGDAKLPDSVFALDKISHDWLFERCSAAVHHGGAGTAAAALKAGLPSVVVPHMIDQKAWGRALHELGAAPAPIPRRKLSAQRLQEAIVQTVTNSSLREHAAALGRRIRAEDGIACAVDVFERHMERFAEPSVLELTNG
jgi:sterol 3beta-glucosyltransferase